MTRSVSIWTLCVRRASDEAEKEQFKCLRTNGVLDQYDRVKKHFDRHTTFRSYTLGMTIAHVLEIKRRKSRSPLRKVLPKFKPSSSVEEDAHTIAEALCRWDPICRKQFLDGVREHSLDLFLKITKVNSALP